MDRILVLYHGGGCADGFCSAWIARKKLGDNAEYLPVNYGEDPPSIDGRKVYLLDFCYKRPVLLEMAKQSAYPLTIIDHHQTAMADVAGIEKETLATRAFDITFDLGHSGARLTWDRFCPDQPRSWLVDYTEDRDLWAWKLPESRAINAALRSYPMTFAAWDELAQRDLATLIPEGQAILRYQEEEIRRAVSHATFQPVAGFEVPCINSTTLISEIAGRLAETPNVPFAACWFERADGKRVYSLRSREDGIDVSKVARTMGGGGHPHAAGFEVEA